MIDAQVGRRIESEASRLSADEGFARFGGRWGTIWSQCSRRFRVWRAPPRWSDREWRDEARAQGLASACQALRDFDPSRGVPLELFVRRRVLAGVLTLYRREWSHAKHYRVADDRFEPIPNEPPSSAAIAFETLREPLAELTDRDRSLIEHLFWDGRTESEIAATLGISQQAVSKRKRAVLAALRRALRKRIGAEFRL